MAGDVKVAVVSAALGDGTPATADFTKSGFGTPKACIVLTGADNTDNASTAQHSKISIGFSNFTDDYCITHQDENGSAKVDCDALKSNTSCYVTLLTDASVGVRGTASAITDGVRLTNTDGIGGTSFATVIMFGGADLAASLQSSSINSSQDGTATISHSGFTDGNDKLIFFIGSDISGEDSASSGINNSFGVCHATGTDAGGWTFVQRCMGWASDHNATEGAPSSTINTDQVLSMITEAGTQDWSLEVTAYSNSGGTWTVTTRDNGAGSGMEVYSLALDLDSLSAKVGSVTSPTSGATWTPSVSLGFTPQYVGMGVGTVAAYDTINSFASSGALGISSNTGTGEETCHSWYNENAAPDTNTNNLFRSRVVDLRDDVATTVKQDHSHSSFNSGDWTYTLNTSIEARAWFYWTIEEAAAEGSTTQKTLTISATGIAALTRATVFANAPAITGIGVVGFGRVLTASRVPVMTAVGVPGMARGISLTRTVTATATPTLARVSTFPRTLAATAIGVAGLTKAKLFLQAATAVAVGVVTRVSTIGMVRAITAAATPSLSRVTTFARAFSHTAVGVTTRVNKILMTKAVTALGVVTFAKGFLFTKALAIAATGVASVVKTVGLSRAVTAAGVAAVIKTVGLTRAVTAVGTATVNKTIGLQKAITAVGVSSLETIATFIRGLSMTATGVAGLVALKTFLSAHIMTATGVAGFSRVATFIRGFVVTAVAAPAVVKCVATTKAVVATGISGFGRMATFPRAFSATAIGVAVLAKVATFAEVLAATAIGVAGFSKNFISGSGAVIKRLHRMIVRVGRLLN